ncbi:RpoD/SigA family RNA polymerase sigma factor [Mastigocoleus sp. MO_188.B34]|uniref:RpoD/SigA family RNA polymerase sigma factor n=1 Tax=Mastigocoleus sp. MO_188.B34 TaxID=3036635 RepID=UPI00263061F4|nr:RpoD/SigA family RNA polymerase sigma factor [Mastigocoleus sp. MO_188.B34]MDJ0692923.1 RpoD/SigA family RNA polymerase sigma factor [Mastigocoleus sp. MO_188.B34]
MNVTKTKSNSVSSTQPGEKYHYHLSNDIVKSYLREVGRIPVLTTEQEIYYGKQVQQMMLLLEEKKKLELELNYEPTISQWAEKMQLSQEILLQQFEQGRIAKQKMIRSNLRLVVYVAKKYQKRNMEFLDLIQEGSLGLERGVEKFDPTRGYKFSTYAYWWIRQGITRAIAQQGRTISLPIHITEKLTKIKRVQTKLSQELGRTPKVAEIAQALSLEPQKIREYLSLIRQPISLATSIGSERDMELQDILKDEGLSGEIYVDRELLSEDINKLLLKLTPQERKVLTLRFGLVDGKELTLAQVGKHMDMSRERVRQLEKQAIGKLGRHRDKIHSHLSY